MSVTSFDPLTRIGFSDTELFSYLQKKDNQVNRHRYEFLLAVAELDRRDICEEKGSPNTAAYLQRVFKVSRTTAYEYIRLGDVVRRFPRIGELLATSQISYTMLRTLQPFLTLQREQQIIDICLGCGADNLLESLRDYFGVTTPEKEPVNHVGLHLNQRTGRYTVEMDLDAATGALFEAMLKAGELAFFGNSTSTMDLTSDGRASNEVAQAGYEFAHPELDAAIAAAYKQYDGDTQTSTVGPALAHRRFAGLMGMMKLIQATNEPSLRAPGAQVTVLVGAEGQATLPSNPLVKHEAIINMIANGHIRTETLDEKGHVINYGRAQRLGSKIQCRALLAQWGGKCAMPGCNHSRFIELHHIRDWVDGGTTDINNLLPLCSRCHVLVSDGMAIIAEDDRDPSLLWFMFADGDTYVSKNRTRPMRIFTPDPKAKSLTVRMPDGVPSFDDIYPIPPANGDGPYPATGEQIAPAVVRGRMVMDGYHPQTIRVRRRELMVDISVADVGSTSPRQWNGEGERVHGLQLVTGVRIALHAGG